MIQARFITIKTLGLTAAVAVGIFFSGELVVAQNTNVNTSGTVAARNVAAGRLEAAKLRACQQREQAINKMMLRIADRAERQVTLFTMIATRVETFYIDKGQTISNYDNLVAEVTAKKTAAETQISTLKNDSAFDCTSNDPKGMATTFKDSLRATITAMQNYKLAVKNLIVGVKSAQGQTSSANNNSSAE